MEKFWPTALDRAIIPKINKELKKIKPTKNTKLNNGQLMTRYFCEEVHTSTKFKYKLKQH